MSDAYNADFFDRQADGSQRSASEVVPFILAAYSDISSVVDVGCGVGTWLAEFRNRGVNDVLGIDGFPPDSMLRIPQELFARKDLTRPIRLERQFDLALCLEVGEHLPPERAAGLVADLCDLADTVVFSAAIPYQGGDAHINEQWPSYWAKLFAARGFGASDNIRPQIWDNNRIEWWYRQNIVSYSRHLPADYRLRDIDRVHPDRWIGTVAQPKTWRRAASSVVPTPMKIAIKTLIGR